MTSALPSPTTTHQSRPPARTRQVDFTHLPVSVRTSAESSSQLPGSKDTNSSTGASR
ncbi:hypothetical protein AB0F46_20325 [Streptomyces sp. NPDC026665]|uniref:hypothetical protein n=1 Tax=Streptomyces sp. NPDC026665 TaxID=3154798 RepID=UPI0033EC0087